MVGAELAPEGLPALINDCRANLMSVRGIDTVHNIICRDATVETKPCFETPPLHLGRNLSREYRKVIDSLPKYFRGSLHSRQPKMVIRRGVVFVKYSREIACAPACLIDMSKVAQRAIHSSPSPEKHVVAFRLGAKKQWCKFQVMLLSYARIRSAHLS